MSSEVKALDDIDELLPRLGGSYEVSVGERAVLEEVDVAGEDDAPVTRRDANEIAIDPSAVVERVEAEESEKPCEPSKVAVYDEPYGAKWFGPYLEDRCDVEGLEHRVDGDTVSIGDAVREVDGVAIDDD